MNVTLVQGECSGKFEGVARKFEQLFLEYGEIGASFAVVIDGEIVIDLWGGIRDRDKDLPWEQDTVANVWSTTKGLVSTCIAMLVSRGRLDYVEPVSSYWPEFAAHGKSNVTVGQLISHQAGLCGFRRPVALADLYNSEAVAEELRAMAPWWPLEEGSGYHALTVGFLLDELVRRVEGRSLQDFVASDLGDALGLNVSIGLPIEKENNVAASYVRTEAIESAEAVAPEIDEVQAAALANPVLQPTISNDAEWRKASIPSANGFADARSLARLYGCLATDGRLGGIELVGAKAREAMVTEQWAGRDRILGLPVRWACGYLLNSLDLYGPGKSAFGHSGWGGSFAYADPEYRMGVAYVMNAMGSDLVGDPRATSLVGALYDSLAHPA